MPCFFINLLIILPQILNMRLSCKCNQKKFALNSLKRMSPISIHCHNESWMTQINTKNAHIPHINLKAIYLLYLPYDLVTLSNFSIVNYGAFGSSSLKRLISCFLYDLYIFFMHKICSCDIELESSPTQHFFCVVHRKS